MTATQSMLREKQMVRVVQQDNHWISVKMSIP